MENLLQSFLRQQTKEQCLTTTLQNYEGEVDYKKLEEKSNAFAVLLKDAGCRKGDRIGCMTEKMSSALISILGIMKVGCVCVPVNSRYNREQIRSVMFETNSRWLLADESVSVLPDAVLFETGEINLGWLGDAHSIPNGVIPEFIFKNIDQYVVKSTSGNSRAEKKIFRFVLPNSKKPLEEHQVASSTIAALREVFPEHIIKNQFGSGTRNGQSGEAVISGAVNSDENDQSSVFWSNSCDIRTRQKEKFIFGFAEESMLSRLKNVGFIREMKDIYLNFWREIERESYRRLELQ